MNIAEDSIVDRMESNSLRKDKNMKYNFQALNDKEFETLAIQLISKLLNRRIERFKSGKDQ